MSGTLTQFPTGATQYRINFEYLARAFVVVTLVDTADNSKNKVLVAGNDYRFLNPTTIEILASQTGFDIMQIHRDTSTGLIVDFRDGSVLTASDLTNAELQAIHIAEEGRDQTIERGRQYADAAGQSANEAADTLRGIEDIVTSSGLDSTLRSDLAAPDGYELIPSVAPISHISLVPITALASFDRLAIEASIKESMAKYGYAYLPGSGVEYTKYRISDTASTVNNIVGARLIVDEKVWIDSSYDLYSLYKSFTFEGVCKLTFRDELFGTTGGQVLRNPTVAKLSKSPQIITPIPFDETVLYTLQTDLDTFTQGAKGSYSSTAIDFTSEGGKYAGLYVGINVGETISAHIGSRSATPQSSGIILRGDLGWIMLDGFSGGTEWRYRVKPIGQPLVNGTPIQVPESGALRSYSATNSTVGISLVSPTSFNFVVNGVALGPRFGSLVGNIYEIGFVTIHSTTQTSRLTGLNVYTSKGGTYGHAPLNILIRGDSTAEGFVSAFDTYLPQLLDGVAGTRSLNIVNKAKAGAYMRQQLDELKAEGAGTAYMVVMVGGTNEGQGNVDPDTFGAMVKEFADWCITNGRVPVWVEPWMWYSKDLAGGAGQASANYDGAAALREAGKRVMASYGDSGIVVSTTHSLPAPLPHYKSMGLEIGLRDDIHQDQLGYKLYAEIIASSIIEWTTRVSSTPRPASSKWSRNHATVVFPSIVTKSRAAITLTLSGFANGEVVMQLPRGCRPTVPTNVPVTFSTDGISYSTGVATIAATGAVSIKGLTSTSGTAYFTATW